MNQARAEQLTELHQNYNDLGEDLLLLESVLLAAESETSFPEEYVASSLCRMGDYIRQHTSEINQLSHILSARRAPAHFPRMAEK